jgi:hypothetical protein
MLVAFWSKLDGGFKHHNGVKHYANGAKHYALGASTTILKKFIVAQINL